MENKVESFCVIFYCTHKFSGHCHEKSLWNNVKYKGVTAWPEYRHFSSSSYLESCKISLMELWLFSLKFFANRLYHRCFTGFKIHLCNNWFFFTLSRIIQWVLRKETKVWKTNILKGLHLRKTVKIQFCLPTTWTYIFMWNYWERLSDLPPP